MDGLGSRFLIDTSAYVSQLLIPSHACVRASDGPINVDMDMRCTATLTLLPHLHHGNPPSFRPVSWSVCSLQRSLQAYDLSCSKAIKLHPFFSVRHWIPHQSSQNPTSPPPPNMRKNTSKPKLLVADSYDEYYVTP